MPGRTSVGSAVAGAVVVLVALGTIAGGTAAHRVGTASAIASPGIARTAAADAGLALGFVQNRGQTNARVRYYARGDRYAFYLTRDEVMLAFATRHRDRGLALALRFVGRNPGAKPEGVDRAPGEVNYLRGNDPTKWRTRLRHFRQVVYRDLWPRVDLRVSEQAGMLKYEFRVRPGGRPSDIRLAYAGARGVTLDNTGRLLVRTALGVLRDSAPLSYQRISGARVRVTSRYVVDRGPTGAGRFGFAVGRYRADRELVIDPAIGYTTFLGGSSHESAAGIAVDASGNAYVVGTTQSPDFPTTAGAFRRTGATGNVSDVFVSKLNAAGTALVYSTFVGGSGFDSGRRVAIDGAGNAYISGQTTSSNFPTTGGAFSRNLHIPANCPRCANVDNYDGFVAKLNAAGSGLVYSTYLGGTDIDSPRGIAVDGAGNAYVTGETVSVDFPTTAGAFSRTERGAYDIFVTKLNANGTALVYSTYLGGAQVDNGERVAVDAGGNAYVLGFSSSVDFPTTPGAFDTTANGDFDTTLTKLDPAGSSLVYSTYLGGQGSDGGGGLFVDAAGNAYVSGGTASLNFPTTAGAFDTAPDGDDAFVTKLNATGSAATYSTVLGGTADEGASAVVVDTAGDAWLTGITSSADFPVTADAADRSFNGSYDVVVSELDSAGSTLLYSTFLGGTQSDSGNDITRDSGGNVYVAGHTYSPDFPATTGAFDTVFNGDPSIFWGDAFVAKLTPGTTTSPAPASLQSVAVSPTSVTGGSSAQGTVTLSAAAPAAGAAVALSSSNPGVATVPASVTVSGGATSATFGVSTSSVTTSTSVTISATYNGTTRTASLTVTPPAQTATLTVTATGRGGERVTSSPAGIDVPTGSSGSASFAVGTAITLSVSNGRDAIWSGACSSGGNKTKTCTFTLAGTATVTANVQ